MGVYGEITRRASGLARRDGVRPAAAWRRDVEEKHADPAVPKNALKHTRWRLISPR